MGYLEKKLQAIISTFWKLKTGNLYVMTSNSAPSPFVASAYSSGAIFINREPYQSFNNNTGDNYQGSIYSGNYFGASLAFNKTIRASKVTASMSIGADHSVTYIIELLKLGGGTEQILSTAISSGGSYSNTITLSAAQQQLQIIGIRHRGVFLSGGSGVQVYLKKCQVTEWYEKG